MTRVWWNGPRLKANRCAEGISRRLQLERQRLLGRRVNYIQHPRTSTARCRGHRCTPLLGEHFRHLEAGRGTMRRKTFCFIKPYIIHKESAINLNDLQIRQNNIMIIYWIATHFRRLNCVVMDRRCTLKWYLLVVILTAQQGLQIIS